VPEEATIMQYIRAEENLALLGDKRPSTNFRRMQWWKNTTKTLNYVRWHFFILGNLTFLIQDTCVDAHRHR
jgi:hypothetical protein